MLLKSRLNSLTDNRDNFGARVLLGLLIFFVPFGSRIFLHSFIPGFHEYEAVFLYISDLLIISFIILAFQSWRPASYFRRYLLLDLFLLAAGISVFFAASKGLAVYVFLRLLILILFAILLGVWINQKKASLAFIFKLLASFGVIQAVIAAGQFMKQSSLGLSLLGESWLGPSVLGVAKIPIAGAHLIRGYGTFPHPNILAAFLLIGLFSLYYWYVIADQDARNFEFDRSKKAWENFKVYVGAGLFYKKIFLSVGLGIILLGILLTFSRAAWGITALLTLIFLFRLFYQRNFRRASLRLFVTLLATGGTLLILFSWAIFPRATISLNEPAVTDRLSYNEIGLKMIANHPLGVGIGNQVLHGVQNNVYQDAGLRQVWQWQPIHNIYVLMASEIGIVGLLAFLGFLALIIFNSQTLIFNKSSINNRSKISADFKNCHPADNSPKGYKLSIENYISKIILAALLIFGLFDHFLWTLQPGRVMLWLVIGLVLGSLFREKNSLKL